MALEDGLNQTDHPNDGAMPDECNAAIDSTSQFFLVFLYSVTCVLSIAGNFSVIRAVMRIETLQTFSNYFLLSLATADLMIGLTMNPVYIVFATFEATPEWVIRMENFVWIATVAASTLSLSAVSIDRYVAIASPLIYPQLINEKRCLGVIVSIWLFSFAFASLRFAFHDFEQLEKLWITTSVVTMFIPLTIIAFCYFHIFKIVRAQIRSIRVLHVHRESHGNNNAPSQGVEVKKNIKAALTVAIIIGLFVLMFLPSVVIFIMLLVANDPCMELMLNYAWMWAAGVSFAHSAINPWIYAFRSSEFRRAIKGIFSCKPW